MWGRYGGGYVGEDMWVRVCGGDMWVRVCG